MGTAEGDARDDYDDDEEDGPEDAQSPFVLVVCVDSQQSAWICGYVGGTGRDSCNSESPLFRSGSGTGSCILNNINHFPN